MHDNNKIILPSVIFFECVTCITVPHDHSNSARSGLPLSMIYVPLVCIQLFYIVQVYCIINYFDFALEGVDM